MTESLINVRARDTALRIGPEAVERAGRRRLRESAADSIFQVSVEFCILQVGQSVGANSVAARERSNASTRARSRATAIGQKSCRNSIRRISSSTSATTVAPLPRRWSERLTDQSQACNSASDMTVWHVDNFATVAQGVR